MNQVNWIYALLPLLFGVAIPSSAAPPADPHRGPMPEAIYSPRITSERPVFVREDRILLSDGTLDPGMFHESNIFTIRNWYLDQAPSEPCIEVRTPGDHQNMPELHWSDYASVVEDSDFIVVARVTGVATGFWGDSPGTVARLKPMQWLKGERTWDLKYLFFPSGEVSLGGLKFCVSHGDYPETPVKGDKILVAYPDNYRRNYPWISANAPRRMVLRSNGKAEFPRWVRERHPEWVGKSDFAVVGEVRKLVRQIEAGAEP